jgi:hypothetical protein
MRTDGSDAYFCVRRAGAITDNTAVAVRKILIVTAVFLWVRRVSRLRAR